MLIDRLGRALFWGFAFLLVYLSMQFAAVGIETSSPGMVYHLTERKMALYMHIVFASLAMLLLPFQFWKGLRRSRPDIHRMLGRFCFAGIILGGTAGGIVGFGTAERYGAIGAMGFVTGALLWVSAAIVAVHFARVRNLASHQTWMIITAALAFGAVSIRFEILFFRAAFEMSHEQASALAAWTCWLTNLTAVAWWHREELMAGRVRFA